MLLYRRSELQHKDTNYFIESVSTFQAIFVPIQGFLNALAYGWTREDFLSAMSSRRSMTLTNAGWQVTSEREEEDDTEGKEECLSSQYSDLSSSNDEGELEEERLQNSVVDV